MTTETPAGQCPSVHKLGGMRCIRRTGHDGPCWCRAGRDSTGAVTRCEWYSRNGQYVRHLQYVTTYPANGARP